MLFWMMYCSRNKNKNSPFPVSARNRRVRKCIFNELTDHGNPPRLVDRSAKPVTFRSEDESTY